MHAAAASLHALIHADGRVGLDEYCLATLVRLQVIESLDPARNARTGRELWSSRLPTSAFAMPMSYEVNSRQYVVVAAGGHAFVYPKPGDLVRAYALPRATTRRAGTTS